MHSCRTSLEVSTLSSPLLFVYLTLPSAPPPPCDLDEARSHGGAGACVQRGRMRAKHINNLTQFLVHQGGRNKTTVTGTASRPSVISASHARLHITRKCRHFSDGGGGVGEHGREGERERGSKTEKEKEKYGTKETEIQRDRERDLSCIVGALVQVNQLVCAALVWGAERPEAGSSRLSWAPDTPRVTNPHNGFFSHFFFRYLVGTG